MGLIKKILIIFTLVMLAGLTVFSIMIKKGKSADVDVVKYYDCLYNITEDYKNGLSEEDIEAKYDCNLILSTDALSQEIVDSIKKRAVVMEFAPEGEIIGRVTWDTEYKSEISKDKKIMTYGIVLWFVIFISVNLAIILIYIFMIKPVKELHVFSEEIAKGNLDIALPRHKNNLFGNFTESFDIMREELRASKEREIEADKQKKELVAELSHDIKTPVATIRTTCEVMMVKYQRKLDELKNYINSMSENTDNGENISNDIKNNADKINDLVELEKERKDALEKVNLISEKVNVIEKIMSDIFDATMDELDHLEINVREEESGIVETYFREMTTVKNITIANNIPECLVYMDKLRLEQVFDNVISNSVKYSGTEINVSFDEIEGIANEKGRKDSFIKITIRDKGPGVPEDELPLITEKYYRGSDVKEKDGFGIGLYLVKVYMEKQGGGFEYYNDDGFVVELYLKKV